MKRLAEYLIYLYVFFMVIDPSGYGDLTKIPFINISIKYCILLILLILILLRLLGWTLDRKWPANYFNKYLVSLICFALFYVLIGLLRGNEPNYILKDSLGLFYYAVGFLIIPFLDKKEQIFNLLKVLFISTLFVNVFLMVTEAMLINNAIPVDVVNLLVAGNNLGLYLVNISNTPFYRIMLRAGIFVQMGAVLSFSMLFLKKHRRYKSYLFCFAACLIGLIILFARGYWIGFLVSVFIVMLYNMKNKEIRTMFVVFFAMLAIISIFTGVANIRFENAFVDRFISSFNFVEDESNMIRVEQFDMLKNKVLEHPFIGGGYGTYIEGYSRDPDQPYYFELDYMAMLMKFGLIGFVVLAGLFFKIFKSEYDAIKLIEDKEVKAVGIGVFASVMGLLVTAATNPFLNGVLGNFIVLYSMILFNLIKKGEKIASY